MSNSVHSWATSERSCTASRTMIGRSWWLLASVAVALTQALVEQPVISSVSTRWPIRWPTSVVLAKALACSLAMTSSVGSGATRWSMSQARRSQTRKPAEKSAADLTCGRSVAEVVEKTDTPLDRATGRCSDWSGTLSCLSGSLDGGVDLALLVQPGHVSPLGVLFDLP